MGITIRYVLIVVVSIALLSAMIACALPRKTVSVERKKVLAWVLMGVWLLLMIASVASAEKSAKEFTVGMAWFIVFGGARLMFQDKPWFRIPGRIVMYIGFVFVLAATVQPL